MNLNQYARILRRNIRLILTFLAVGLLVSVVYLSIRQPNYTSEVQLYVAAQSGDNPQQAYQAAQLSQQRVTSYTDLIKGPLITRQVVEQLGLPVTPDQLAKKITATANTQSIIITVTATDHDPVMAARIANSISANFSQLVAQLEAPIGRTGPPDVVIRTVEPATIPYESSSPSGIVILAAGLLAGGVAGIGLALLLNAIVTTLRSEEELQEITGLPNLASISESTEVSESPAGLSTMMSGLLAEQFRQLRTNLQFLDFDSERRVLMFTSALASEGKSTTAAHTAVVLALAGNRVLLIDADLRRPRLATMFGLDDSVGLTSVLANRLEPQIAVQKTQHGGLDVLTTGPQPPNPSELLASQNMRKQLQVYRATYDIVLIDTPPSLVVTDARALGPSTDGVILVCKYGSSSRSELARTVESFNTVGARQLGTVFTMVPLARGQRGSSYTSYYNVPSGNSASADRGVDAITEQTRRAGPSDEHNQPSPTPRPHGSGFDRQRGQM